MKYIMTDMLIGAYVVPVAVSQGTQGFLTMADKNTYLTFSNGIKVPQIGLGTYKSKPGEVENAVKTAIDTGYRHLDCAFVYENEKEIGDALHELLTGGAIKREDLFVTTKLWANFHRPDKVEQAIRLSLKDLQLDYVDLYLMHSPMGAQYKGDRNFYPEDKDGKPLLDDIHFTETWKAMEHLVEKGLVRSIGVSNFNISQVEEVLKIAKVPVVANQVENHPCIDQRELIDFCKSKNILVIAYSPLGFPDRSWTTEKDPNIQEDPLVEMIAEDKGCTPVQLLISYNLSQGLLCIPKSVTPSRIKQNFQALGVQLTKEEIEKLDTLVTDYRACAWEFWSHHLYYPFPDEVEQISNEMIK